MTERMLIGLALGLAKDVCKQRAVFTALTDKKQSRYYKRLSIKYAILEREYRGWVTGQKKF